MNAALKPDFAAPLAFMAAKHGLLINNEWCDAASGKTLRRKRQKETRARAAMAERG